MKKVIFAGFLGAVILFVWGFFSWMVIPWHIQTLNDFKTQTAVVKTMKVQAPRSGIYFLPSFKSAKQSAKTGMTVFAAVHYGKMGKMGPYMRNGFLIQLISALLVAFMLLKAGVPHYTSRVLLITLFGLAAGIQGYLPSWNWWHFATDYTLVGITDMIIGWFLAGLVMACFL